MVYTPTSWSNDGPPAVNATNLNKIEAGIEGAHDAIGSPFGYRTSQYYPVGFWSVMNGNTSFGQFLGGFYVPFQVFSEVTIKRLTAYIHTPNGAAVNARLGVYGDTDGAPGTLLKDAGTFDTNTSGLVHVSVSPTLTLPPGGYWLAMFVDEAATATRFYYAEKSTNPGAHTGYDWSSTLAQPTRSACLKAEGTDVTTYVNGGLPASAPVSNLQGVESRPILWFQVN